MEKRKAFFVSEECHEKVKQIALLEKQSAKEWVEWVINRAYETYFRKKDNPFKTWGRSVAPKGELPPGYNDEELN